MKILYVMQIPWGWIKQRPHFLAEKLAKNNYIDVKSKIQYTNRHQLKKNKKSKDLSTLNITPYDIIPFDKIPILNKFNLKWLNSLILKLYLPNLSQYDYLWIASPYTFYYLENLISENVKIVYDCMDDYPEFPDISQWRKQIIIHSEKRLLERANIVFASSQYLKDKILRRSGIDKNIIVINNAIELPKINTELVLTGLILDKFKFVDSLERKIIYVGTVSSWFDFETMIKVLDYDKKLNLILIGPIATEIPIHSRIHSIGAIQRDYIFKFMDVADYLVMPFILNELIKSVNPVKIYEYIYTGKPVIVKRYSETEKFANFVNLYETAEDFINVLKVNHTQNFLKKNAIEYVQHNTWDSRAFEIEKILEMNLLNNK